MSKIIDSNLPLPSNTKYEWSECFAKLMLGRVIDKKLNNLIIDDKPDLQNTRMSIGIEVTSSVDINTMEMEGLYIGLEYGLIKNKDGALKKIKKLGGKIYNGILTHPRRTRTLNNIYKSFKNKTVLLNDGEYSVFKHNYIFIIDDNLILEPEINDIIKQFELIQQEYKYNFEKAYIYIYGNNFYELDLKHRTHISYQLSNNDVSRISEDARTMVEQGESI